MTAKRSSTPPTKSQTKRVNAMRGQNSGAVHRKKPEPDEPCLECCRALVVAWEAMRHATASWCAAYPLHRTPPPPKERSRGK